MFAKLSNDLKTTLLGSGVAVGVGSQVDLQKLLQGDPTEIGKVVVALCVFGWGLYTNKKDPPKS